MKFCEKCGLRLEEDTLYCNNCRNILLVDDEKTSLSSSGSGNMSSPSQNASIENHPESSQFVDLGQRARLCVVKGGTDGREFPLTNSICNIGRWDPSLKSHPEIDLSDEDIDAKVSRLHARIIKKPEGYYIEDSGSRNGTFLNREFRLVQGIEYSLKDNDEIIIGHIFFKFKLD